MTYYQTSVDVSKRDEPLELVFNETESDQPMFIEAPEQEESKIKPKKAVKFKSNQTRRVELESFRPPDRPATLQAPMSGQTKPQKIAKKTQQRGDGGSFSESKDGRIPLLLPGFQSTSAQPLIPAHVQQKMPPGVRLGNITALNTDQHRFYSFNQRLLSRFVPLWGDQVRRALMNWLAKNNPPSISKSWVTNVEVIMSPKGEILEVQPFRLSGLWSIDNASMNSFRQVKNVPNPPEEMVDENGYIHLQFQTEVLWVPQPGVRFHGGNPSGL